MATLTETECLAIARKVLPDLTTLEVRGHDGDFHTLGVGHIEQLIRAAYEAAQRKETA